MSARTLAARTVPLGGIRGVQVQRTLPHRDLPTIGAWCFLDHFGPTDDLMSVLPHPHCGLQTVTWPLAGDVRHRDSLGNVQTLRPGELNLMTAGDGIAHSEFGVGGSGSSHGVQLWVALPEHARHGAAGFEHHGDLPVVMGDGWAATVFMGSFAGGFSPATDFTPLAGAQVTLSGRARLPLNRAFEHGVMSVDGPIRVDGELVRNGDLRYLPAGADTVLVESRSPRQLIVIGGEPFDEAIVMWWNFVTRTHDEVLDAHEAWNSAAGGPNGRFGEVSGHAGGWIPAPPLPKVRLRPRVRR